MSVNVEFLLDVSHRFVDGYIQQFMTQVNAIYADFASLTVEDRYDIAAEHTAVDGVVIVQVGQIAVVIAL